MKRAVAFWMVVGLVGLGNLLCFPSNGCCEYFEYLGTSYFNVESFADIIEGYVGGLSAGDLSVDGETWSGSIVASYLNVESAAGINELTVNGIWVGTTDFYAAFLALEDEVDTHITNDEMLNCGDVEGCLWKSGASSGASIQCSGQGALSKGMAIVPFDETFASSADATKSIIVLVTPTDAACKGIAVVKTGINKQVEGKTVSGFCAVELNGGESGSTFNWQALGTRK